MIIENLFCLDCRQIKQAQIQGIVFIFNNREDIRQIPAFSVADAAVGRMIKAPVNFVDGHIARRIGGA